MSANFSWRPKLILQSVLKENIDKVVIEWIVLKRANVGHNHPFKLKSVSITGVLSNIFTF